MTTETALWVMSVAVPALFVWCSHQTWAGYRIKAMFKTACASQERDHASAIKRLDKLIEMHESPDEFGFGTDRTNDAIAENQRALQAVIADNTRVMQEIVHYLKWSITESSGTTPPPPMGL